jgi:hypothetical protein
LTKLAKRRFGYLDQKQFAAVSGDYNPMHLDALKARRTQAGAPVVYGVNLLLWALDSLARQVDLPPMRSLRATFNKFVYLNELAEVDLVQQTASAAKLSIIVDGSQRSKFNLDFGDGMPDCCDESAASLEPVPLSPVPLNLDFEQMSSRSGRLPLQMKDEDAESMFPAATKWLGARRIMAVAASTHLVGMVCPGLHSIYSELSIGTCSERFCQDFLSFRVTETDARFRSVEQAIAGGGITGTVSSFARKPPVEQATMQSLAGKVALGEFAGSVALIVGGSRGLGELTAKLVAAGGARVIVTWQSGKEDAERVAEEIRSAGGACETLAYDANKPAAEQLAGLMISPTHAYYFATPAIFRTQSAFFDAERFKEFLAIYVDGFWQLSKALQARQPRLSIFYPSSVSVTERPQGMTEYTMAKAAGEVMCADINASLAPIHVTVSRLPRLLTDQTASITAPETASPLETMLPIIREVQSWPR